ncbi:MAG: prepilin-type N-terminal cleavage/methylation domain-containing protein [Victivallales bacterium]
MRKNTAAKTAFTLIELLIVIAIIAILAAMLLPALKNAKDVAQRAVCASNMKQTYYGLISYYEDFNRYWPYGSDYYATGGYQAAWPDVYYNKNFPSLDASLTSKGANPYSNAGIAMLYANGYVPNARVFYCPSNKIRNYEEYWLRSFATGYCYRVANSGNIIYYSRRTPAGAWVWSNFNRPEPVLTSPVTDVWNRIVLADFFMDFQHGAEYTGHASHNAEGYNLLTFNGSVLWMPDRTKSIIRIPQVAPRALNYGNGDIFEIFDNYKK